MALICVFYVRSSISTHSVDEYVTKILTTDGMTNFLAPVLYHHFIKNGQMTIKLNPIIVVKILCSSNIATYVYTTE